MAAEREQDRPLSVVIDEDLSVDLRHQFGDNVRAETVAYRGWKGLKNGQLLKAIADAGDVDVFITADKNLRHQQKIQGLPFGVLVLRPRSKRLETLIELMPQVLRILPGILPGVVVEVAPPANPISPSEEASREGHDSSQTPERKGDSGPKMK
jgi:hypothetical protein